ncbi:MAG: ZIP family metal transporter [Candidatus Bathyarchaeota archaeon]|nr:ZIP family metal transporter [Candidatus Bathyarchaeota archaeon]MDH5787932.1 ZIP family metal transporter [Candidatus Bathyarchaeota archaeon]
MNDLIVILVSVTTVSLISLTGIVFINLKEGLIKRVLMGLVGLSSGTLLGGAFIHLLPEAYETNQITAFYYVIAGIVAFFVTEKFLYWRHCHEEECPVHMFVYLNLLGDGIHNFIDGMIIAAAYVLAGGNYQLGFATTLAVIFHEIPQEIGDFGVLIYGGLTKKKALTYNFISALTAIFGAILGYFLSYVQGISAFLIPFAAGGFIYIAATDLMPEMHKKFQPSDSVVQLIVILLGVGLMAYLKTAFGG